MPHFSIPPSRRRILAGLALVVGAAVMGTGIPQVPPAAAQERSSDTLPFEIGPGGTPVIQARFNKLPARLLVDTGSTASLIVERMVKPLGVTPNTIPLPKGRAPLFPGQTEVSIARVEAFDFGMLTIPNAPLLVMPEQHGAYLRDAKCDGLFGLNGLSHYAVKLDFAAKKITFWYPGSLTPAELKAQGYEDVPSAPVRPNKALSLKLNGQVDLDVLIDTGSATTRIPFETAQQLKLEPNRRDVPEASPYGVRKTSRGVLKSLAVGPEVLTNVPVAFFPDAAAENQADLLPRLGLDVLSRYTPLIDFPGGKLYLKPRPQARK